MSSTIVNSGNVMRSAYEPTTESLRVNIVGSGSPTIPNVVRLSDGTDYISSTVVGSDRALDVNVVNALELSITHIDDSIRLGNGTSYLTTSTVGAKVALDVTPTDSPTVSNPAITNVTTVLANTEYSHSFGAATKKFLIKPRNIGSLKFSFTLGQSGTTYINISAGSFYVMDSLALTGALTIYFQSPLAGNIIEIIAWS